MKSNVLSRGNGCRPRRAAGIALAACALVAGATLSGALADPPQAQAASGYAAISNRNLRVVLPRPWKKLFKQSALFEGHTSGAYHADFRVQEKNSAYLAFRIDGYDAKNNYRTVNTRTTVKMQKKLAYGSMEWTFKNKSGNVASISINNAYLDAWEAAHGKGYYGFVPTSTWKNLIKIYSGGKTSYAQVKKWSRSKAKKRGISTIRSYANKHIVRNIQLR